MEITQMGLCGEPNFSMLQRSGKSEDHFKADRYGPQAVMFRLAQIS